MSNRPSTAATGAAAFYPRDLLNDRQVRRRLGSFLALIPNAFGLSWALFFNAA